MPKIDLRSLLQGWTWIASCMEVLWVSPKGWEAKADKSCPLCGPCCIVYSLCSCTHTDIYIYVCALVVSGVLWVALTAWTSRFLLAGWQCPPSQGSRSLDPCESWLNCQRNIQKNWWFQSSLFLCVFVCVSVSVIVCVCVSLSSCMRWWPI